MTTNYRGDGEQEEACEETCLTCGNLFMTPNECDPSNRFCSTACGRRWEQRQLSAAPLAGEDDDRDSPIPW